MLVAAYSNMSVVTLCPLGASALGAVTNGELFLRRHVFVKPDFKGCRLLNCAMVNCEMVPFSGRSPASEAHAYLFLFLFAESISPNIFCGKEH